MSIERVILSSLIFSDDFTRKAIPFLKAEYFHDSAERKVFEAIQNYTAKYNAAPSKEALGITLSTQDGIDEDTYKTIGDIVDNLERDNDTQIEWLVDQTEKFCQDKAIYNGIMESIKILDDKEGKLSKGSIPQILSEALGVSFDTSIGHDFIDDADSRFEFYHRVESRMPFDIEMLNNITEGGLPDKTLNVLMAPTGVGKTAVMCHFAAANLTRGKNVLYITMEMAEERIAERIDANLLDVPIKELKTMEKEVFDRKIERVKNKGCGKLIIKEYPTASAGAANFRHLLNELKLKKKFKPDIIYIDYLNICISSRLKNAQGVNSYTYIKAIAEELRGLAVEFGLPIVSATQTNRDGFSNSDIDLDNTSESFGLPMTVDFMVAIISTEELEQLGQVMFKQLKNRYSDVNRHKRFVVGIDRDKMRLYDVEQNAQDDIMDDRPVMDKSEFGEQDYERNRKSKPFDRKAFGEFR